MAIGTTVKLGFDASAVKKGFSLLPKMFAKGMGGLRQVGIGAAQKLGHGVTDLLGKALMAVPDGIKDMMDYAGAMNDLRVQTGMTIKELMTLEEAMRLSGAEGDIGKMISTFSKNLRSAMTEEGGPNEALRRLGFSPDEFKGMKVDEAFKKIGMRVKDFHGDMGELDEIMSSLFGGRMGYKIIRFFRDFDGNWREASSNVASFADRMEKEAGNIDAAGDALGRYRQRWLQLMEIIASAIGLGSGGDMINAAFDWLNPERVRAAVESIKSAMKTGFEWFKNAEYKTLFKDMGHWIGDGIKESMSELLGQSAWFKPFSGSEKPAAANGSGSSAIMGIATQVLRTLIQIRNAGFYGHAS